MLQELGVEINAIDIDSAYYEPGMKFFDKEIRPIEELVKMDPNSVLWVGFNLDKKSYRALQKELSTRFGLEKIYACDCAKYDIFAKQNYKYNDVVTHAEDIINLENYLLAKMQMLAKLWMMALSKLKLIPLIIFLMAKKQHLSRWISKVLNWKR